MSVKDSVDLKAKRTFEKQGYDVGPPLSPSGQSSWLHPEVPGSIADPARFSEK
jgi:hypothetical protein